MSAFTDACAAVTETPWRYFRKNIGWGQGGYIDKWTSSPWSVSKSGGAPPFGPPPGVYRVEMWQDSKYVLIGDAKDVDGVVALLRAS